MYKKAGEYKIFKYVTIAVLIALLSVFVIWAMSSVEDKTVKRNDIIWLLILCILEVLTVSKLITKPYLKPFKSRLEEDGIDEKDAEQDYKKCEKYRGLMFGEKYFFIQNKKELYVKRKSDIMWVYLHQSTMNYKYRRLEVGSSTAECLVIVCADGSRFELAVGDNAGKKISKGNDKIAHKMVERIQKQNPKVIVGYKKELAKLSKDELVAFFKTNA